MSSIIMMITKKQAIHAGLATSFKTGLMIDTRHPDVSVPERFGGMHNLVLEIGLALPIPIPDLQVTDQSVSCTLSFGSEKYHCVIPLSAVYMVTYGDQRLLWLLDAPPEMVRVTPPDGATGAESEPASAPPEKPRHLRLVD